MVELCNSQIPSAELSRQHLRHANHQYKNLSTLCFASLVPLLTCAGRFRHQEGRENYPAVRHSHSKGWSHHLGRRPGLVEGGDDCVSHPVEEDGSHFGGPRLGNARVQAGPQLVTPRLPVPPLPLHLCPRLLQQQITRSLQTRTVVWS